MINTKKIKLSLLLIIGLFTLLSVLIFSLGYIAINSVRRLGSYSIVVDKENLSNTVSRLFLDLTSKTVDEFSIYIEKYSIQTSILVRTAEDLLDKNDSKDTNVKLSESVNGKFFYLDTPPKSKKCIVYWGDKKKLKEAERKIAQISDWFFSYTDNQLTSSENKIHSYTIFNPNENFFIMSSKIFIDPVLKYKFYETILNSPDYIEKFYYEALKKYQKSSYPSTSWITPYYSWSGIKLIETFCTLKDKTGKIKLVAAIDLPLDMNREYMNNISTISSGAISEISNRLDGFAFVADKDGNILTCPEDKLVNIFRLKQSWSYINEENRAFMLHMPNLLNSKSKAIRNVAKSIITDSDGFGIKEITLKGIKYIISYCRIKSTGYILGIMYKDDPLMAPLRETITQMNKSEKEMSTYLGIISVVFLILSLLASYIFLKISLLNPIGKLKKHINKMKDGDFSTKIKVQGGKEISELSCALNLIGSEIKKYTEDLESEIKTRQEIETKIDIAQKMQKMLLPKTGSFANKQNYDLGAVLKAAKTVSGDFYDYFKIDDDKIAFLIADLPGQGLKTTFFMSMTKVLIKNLSIRYVNEPETILEKANETLLNYENTSMFARILFFLFNTKTNELTSINAGHHECLMLLPNGEFTRVGTEHNSSLGILPDLIFKKEIYNLDEGCLIMLFNEGILESVSSDNYKFGLETIQKLILKNNKIGATDLCNKVISEVEAFEYNSVKRDKVILAMKVKSTGQLQ